MSGTRFARRRPLPPLGTRLDWILAAFVVVMLGAMVRYIGATTIPYHFMFLAIGLVYGFRVWPLGRTVVVIGAVTLVTGAIFVRAYQGELIDLDELSEIVLMPVLLLAMIWHARRRDEAMRRAQHLAAVNADLLERQHESLRDTSHAIRAPTTIATGFVELAAAATDDPEVLEALAVVARQLERTGVLSTRLLALAALDSQGVSTVDLVEVNRTVTRLGAEWSHRGLRRWRLEPGRCAWVHGDEAALEGALDALVENALHHTREGQTIRITCRAEDREVVIEVADSGPGVAPGDLESVFQRFWHTCAPDGSMGSGLGLSMAAAVAVAHGGDLTVGTADEGGALFTMRLPRREVPTDAPSPAAPERLAEPPEIIWLPGSAGSTLDRPARVR